MSFSQSIFLYILCVTPLALLMWKVRRQLSHNPIRILIVILLCILIIQPFFNLGRKALHVWLVVDRSASTAESYQMRGKEIEGILTHSKPAEAKLSIVDVADIASLRGQGDEAHYAKAIPESNLALGIDSALSHMSDADTNRLLLLSDGFSTQTFSDTERSLRNQKVALDIRFLDTQPEGDYRVEVVAPREAEARQGAVISVALYGDPEAQLSVALYRDAEFVARAPVTVRAGSGNVTFFDRVGESGTLHVYQARIETQDHNALFKDKQQANNTAYVRTRVLGEAPIILFSSDAEDPLAQELRLAGFRVRLVTDPKSITIAALVASRLCIFNNIAAAKFPQEILGAIPFAVKELGLGVLMIGGQSSFASGGYFGSPIADVLPVSLELREEQRRIQSFLVLSLDRSGSMGMVVQGNSGSMQKMDLANEGAARSIELLGPKDQVALFAVDSEPTEIIPPTRVGSSQQALATQARSVTVGGGGIYVFEALQAAWGRLKDFTGAGGKHIILFSDAADSEEPGDYKNLIELMRKAGVTISVIGMGSENDPDAELLKDIAARGAGRIFFVNNALDVPAVFQQETASFARSLFITERIATRALTTWNEISPRASAWLSHIDGYNLTYLKGAAGAKAGLLTQDEYAAPLVAWWQRGIGRVATIAFPWNGSFSESTRSWKNGPESFATLVRWLKGSSQPAGLRVRSSVQGSDGVVEVFYSSDWEKRFANQGASLSGLEVGSAEWDSSRYVLQEVAWEKIEPGHLRARVPLTYERPWLGVLRFAEVKIEVGPLERTSTEEWKKQEREKRNLVDISKITGGKLRLDVASVWEEQPEVRQINFTIPLVIILIFLILIDALMTRLGKGSMQFSLRGLQGYLPTRSFVKNLRFKTDKKTFVKPEEQAAAPVEEPVAVQDSFNEALQRAKRK